MICPNCNSPRAQQLGGTYVSCIDCGVASEKDTVVVSSPPQVDGDFTRPEPEPAPEPAPTKAKSKK